MCYPQTLFMLKGILPMKAILIDDDLDALNELAALLSTYDDLKVVGKYENPYVAIEECELDQVDVIFLETVLPRVSGVSFAKHLKELKPTLSIVFITKYEEYALDAFNLHALDYVLKPVKKNRLDNTIERLKARNLRHIN